MTHLIPLLVATSLGAFLATTARCALNFFGPAPHTLLLPLASLLALFGLLSLLPARQPANRRGLWMLALPTLLTALADPMLALASRLPVLPEAITTAAGLSWTLAALPFLRRASASLHGKPSPLLLIAGSIGLLAGLLPPLPASLVAAGLLLLAVLTDKRPARDVFDLAGARAVVAVLLATTATTTLWLSLRAALDPTAAAAGAVAAAALLGAALGRAVSTTLLWPRLLAAGAALLGVWMGWGLLWAQTRPALGTGLEALWAPLLVGGAIGGLVTGWSWGRTPAPLAWLGAAGGLALAAGLSWGPTTGPMLVGGVGALALLLGAHPGTRIVGGLLISGAGGTLFLERSPVATLAVEGRYTQLRTADAAERSTEARAGMREAYSSWGGAGLVAVRAPEALWTTTSPQRAGRLQVEIDGLVTELPSRADQADALAGHIAGALAPERPRLLVLGDELGTALGAALLYAPAQARVSVPFPEVARAIAPLDPAREQSWLDPVVQLEPVHPETLLRLTPASDAIIEISRAPWADAGRSHLSRSHLAAVSRRLSVDGVYVLALHLLWQDRGRPETIVADVTDHFEHVQLWMPPAGADTLLIVASHQPRDLSRLVARTTDTTAALAALNLRGPLALASLAITDTDAAAAWAAGGHRTLSEGLALSGVIWSRPLLHLATLSAHVAAPTDIWGAVLDAEQAEDLDGRQAARRRLLSLLGRAAEGDMRGVFSEASQMRTDQDGVAALDPLIEPHLRDARSALRTAAEEGPDSLEWDAALRSATTAQMLSPASPRPHLALGDIAMAQRDLGKATEHYEVALEQEPSSIAGLTALARIASLRDDRIEQERLLREAVAQNARSWQAHQNLGVMLLFFGRYDEAEASLKVAVALSEGVEESPLLAMTEIYLATEQPTRALTEAERATQIGGSAQSWFLRGRAHYALEQLDLAAEDYQRAVLTDPSHAVARAAYGHVRAVQGRYEEAAEALRLALQEDPNNDAARELLRRIQRELRAREALGPPE